MADGRDTDIAWLAGFFDGEGCVTIIQHRRGFELAIVTGNTNKESIERCQRIAGGHVYFRERNDGHKPVWWWNASGQEAKRSLGLILPHLTVKRDQAKIALAFPMPGHRRDKTTGRMLAAGPLTKIGQAAAYQALREAK